MTTPFDAQHIANQAGDFAPQHKNNFAIEIAGLDGDDKNLIVLSLMSLTLPTSRSESLSIPYGNGTRKFAGKVEYDAISLVIHDYVDRQTRDALVRWRRQVHDPETGLNGLPSAYKKRAQILLYSSDGSISRACDLVGVWPQEVQEGEMSMDTAEAVQITVALEYDEHKWQL